MICEPLKILILVDCYLPSPESGAELIHDLGVEFVRQEPPRVDAFRHPVPT